MEKGQYQLAEARQRHDGVRLESVNVLNADHDSDIFVCTMHMAKTMQERVPAVVPAFVGVQARQLVQNSVEQELLRETSHSVEVDMDEPGCAVQECFVEDGGRCAERDGVTDEHKRGQ